VRWLAGARRNLKHRHPILSQRFIFTTPQDWVGLTHRFQVTKGKLDAA
jgi:hypothetical protein